METPGQTLTLYPKKLKIFFFFLLSIVFSFFSLGMALNGNPAGWLLSLVMVPMMFILPIALLPNRIYLKLTPEGYWVKTPIQKAFTKWSDVDFFFVGYNGHKNCVSFDYVDAYTRKRFLRRLNSAMAGAEGSLNDNYGLSLKALAGLMNEWKTKHEERADANTAMLRSRTQREG